MTHLARGSRALLFVIAAVLVFWALKATRPVTLPLAFGLVLLLLFRPLQRRLDRHLPRALTVIVVLLACLAFLGALGGMVSWAAARVAPEVPAYAEQLGERLQGVEDWLRQRGLSVSLPGDAFAGLGGGAAGGASGSASGSAAGSAPGAASGESAAPSPSASTSDPSSPSSSTASSGGLGADLAGRAASTLSSLLGGLGLVVLTLTVLVFLLIEVDGFRHKLSRELGDGGDRFLDAFDRMAGRFGRYFLVQAFTSLLTGVLTWGWCALLGVQFAFVWGLVAFAFNFVPTVGSILAVVPPTLFALAFGGPGTALALFAGLVVIQLALGNFVDPALQGRAVDLSPVVVLLAVVFWGWLWGVGGAIIAVPLTIALVLVFEEFEGTRGIALFLEEPRKG